MLLHAAALTLTTTFLAVSGAAIAGTLDARQASPPPSLGSYAWPVTGEVIRGFDAPTGPFGAGHRGIDIQGAPGAAVRAAEAGVVAFAGKVAGELHVSIDHPDGVRTSYAFLSGVAVKAGDLVARGEPVGSVGAGHAGSPVAHLHRGARFAGVYIDPMLLLEGRSLVGMIRLAPLESPGS